MSAMQIFDGGQDYLAINTDGSINVTSVSTITTIPTGTDANSEKALNLDNYNVEIQTDATYTYIGHAVTGTALATAAWRAQRVTTATGTRIFADGGAFSQVATDLTALTYAV